MNVLIIGGAGFIVSLFVDLINFSEKVSPIFTPKNVLDNQPLMKKIEKNTL